jgi:hypothetical protein
VSQSVDRPSPRVAAPLRDGPASDLAFVPTLIATSVQGCDIVARRHRRNRITQRMMDAELGEIGVRQAVLFFSDRLLE